MCYAVANWGELNDSYFKLHTILSSMQTHPNTVWFVANFRRVQIFVDFVRSAYLLNLTRVESGSDDPVTWVTFWWV